MRSISVRYSASVGQLVSELNRAAQANAKLADSADAAGKKQDDMANKLAIAGTVLATGLGVSIAKFAEFDAQMSAVGAATGKTGDQLTALRDAAVVAGADTQYSATEAASAITELSKAGVDAADILGGGLTGALNLAASGQMDVADAAETMATALAQFNLHGDQASHVADLLAAGAGKAQGSVDDMGQALKQSGLVANQTGLSIEETTAALTAFANAGLIGSDAGTSLKTMLQRLTPQSDQAAGMMDDLGISAYDAQGNFIGLAKFAENLKQSMQDLTPQQRNAAMSIIFGSDAVRGATVLYNEGADGINKWTEATNQQGFAAKQAATLTDNLKGDIERLGGALDTTLIKAGSGANDVMRSMTKTGEGLVEGLGQIPGPILAGTTALGAMMLFGPKLGNLAKTVTGPVNSSMDGFRSRAAYASAQATGFGAQAQGAGERSLTASQRIRVMGAAMGGVRGAAGGLVSMLGGPWGIALAGAAVAVGVWGQKQAEARAAADALNATVDAQTGKFTKASTDTIISSILGDLSPDDQKLLQGLGVDFNALADAALKGGPAYEQQKQKLADLMAQHQGFDSFMSDASFATEGLLNSFIRAGNGAEDVRIKLQILQQVKNDAAVADSRQADSAAAAERNTADLGVAADGAAGSMQAGATAADGMGGSLKDMGGDAKDAKTELEGLMNYIDGAFGSGERALRADQRAFNQSVRDATEAAKDKGGADPAALKAQKKAQDELDAARAATGKGGGSKGSANAIAKAELSLKHANEHYATLIAGKHTALQLESARQRVESAQQRVSQAKSGGGGGGDSTSKQERVKRAEEKLAEATQHVKDTWHDATKAGEDFQAKLDGIAEDGEKALRELIKQNKPIKDINAAYDGTRAAIIKVLDLRGIHGKAAEDEADKIMGTTTAMDQLRWQYANTQAQVVTSIETPGLPEAKQGMKGYWEVINGVPHFVPTEVTTPGIEGAKKKLDGVWEVTNGIPHLIPVTVQVRTDYVSTGTGPAAGNVNPLLLTPKVVSAAGNIVHAYAGGGLDAPNSHVAEIATGGVRMWAEPETQGEGYVPLANDWRRPRAKAITQQIVSRFGGDVTWHAAGSITASSLQRGGGVDVRALAAAMAEMPRGGDHVELHAHSLDIGDGLRRASRDYFWERDHRR